eukprot:Rmarinus@m.26326
MDNIENLAKRSRAAARILQALPTEKKDEALLKIHSSLVERKAEILAANEADKVAAREAMENNALSQALFKRLELGGSKFDSMVDGVKKVTELADPVGKITYACRMDDGLDLYRVSCPIGVLCIIFEARPECVVQISSLSLKSANAVILKGGSEAKKSNQVLVTIIRDALSSVEGFPVDAVQFVETREAIAGLLSMDQYIDMIIPRGSNQLVRHIQQSTRIPVMGHSDGICAVYVDSSADVEKAARVVTDAKTQYPAACNAAETLLIHSECVTRVLPAVAAALVAKGVTLRADPVSGAALSSSGVPFVPSEEKDYDTEFLDLEMAIKVVDSITDAIAHINSHGSYHTDVIISEDKTAAETFMSRVDSANVYHNASSRFADGFRYGFGAEVGVSTCRTHARGPVGMEGLVIYKYRLYGDGHCAGDYSSGKTFKHEPLPTDSMRR